MGNPRTKQGPVRIALVQPVAHGLGQWHVIRWRLEIVRMFWESWQQLSPQEREGQ